MLDDNVPLSDEAVDDDFPIEGVFVPAAKRPEDIQNMYRGHAAALKADADGSDIFTAYSNVDQDADPKNEVSQLSYQRSEDSQQELTDYFQRNLGGTPEEVATDVEVYQSMAAEEQATQSVPERQVAEAFSGMNPEEQELVRATADLELINTLTEITEDYGTVEKGLDIAKAFLPTGIFDNKQIADSFFGAENYLKDVVVGLKDLRRNDPKKYARTLSALISNVKEDLPKGKQLTILSALLDPRGEEELGDFGALWAAFDVVDLASLGAFTAVKVAKLIKSRNAIKLASKLDNTEMATDINSAALLDETGEAAKNAGIDELTAHANSAPFDVTDLDDAYAQGLSADTVARISAVQAKQRKVAEMVKNNDGILKETFLTSAERLSVEQRFKDTMKAEGIDNVSVAARTDTDITFNYQIMETDGITPKVVNGKPVYSQKTIDLSIDDVTGTWVNTEKSLTAAYLKSPTAFANWAGDDVRAALRMDSTSSNIGETFRAMQKDAMKPLLGRTGITATISPKRRREIAELDDVLRAGDEHIDPSGVRGKVYFVDELRGGVVGGKRLNDRQIETYYNLRGLYDELWTIRNDETRKLLTFQGKRQVTVAGAPQTGKPFSKQGAVGFMNDGGMVKVYNSSTDEIVTMTGRDVGRFYDEGLTLNRLDGDIKIPNGNHGDDLYNLVLTRSDDIRDLPQKVIHFKEGYVPKVNVGAYWFVKRYGTKTVNGVPRSNQALKTERMFSSKAEADKWMKSLPDAEKKDLRLKHDREMEQDVMGSSQVGSGGGLYTGARSTDGIPFGVDGTTGERLNTYEALSQNLQSLENYVSRNQWRVGMQQRWINSAKKAGFDVTEFDKNLIPEGHPLGKGLRKMADQIETWSGFPMASELRWDGVVSGLMEWGLNSRLVPFKDKTLVRAANYLRHRNNNPVHIVRNIAFHSMLGVFTPAQLWVQAQGMSIAISLSNQPMKTFRLQNALALATHLGGNHEAVKVLAKSHAVDPTEIAQLTKLWKKTGLESSVVNTADHVAAARGLGIGRESLRKTLDKGLFFYRTGELFNRRISFLVAAERMYRKIKHFDFDDDTLKLVLTDANNMMLNLSKANQAAWQRGVVAIPTQFLQVQAKFLETLTGVNKSFTLRERGRILAGQAVLYGAAGVPLGNLGVRWAQETMGFTQSDIDALPPESVEAINNGMWGVFAHTWLGADVDMSNRGAIASGMTEFTLDLMFSDATIGEKAVGAFGTIPHRAFSGWKTIKPMITNSSEEPLTSQEWLRGLNAIASITSTWSNANKAFMMNSMHQINDSRGNVVVDDKDFSIETETMVLLGFQPSELKRVRDREMLVRSRKEFRAQVTDTLVDHYWNYVQALKGVESEKERDVLIEKYSLGTQVIMKSLRNEGEVQKVRASLNARLEAREDRKTRSIRQYIEEFSDGQVLALGSYVASMQANGLIQTDTQLPEEDDK